MAQSRPQRLLLWMGAGIAVVLVQALIQPPRGSLFWEAVFDAAHAPLFGILAMVVFRCVIELGAWTGSRRVYVYFLALILTLYIGGLTELIQILGPRHADILDFLRNGLGGAAFLLLALAFDRSLLGGSGIRRVARMIAFAGGTALLLVALIPGVRTASAYLQRNAAFPRICSFERVWEREFVTVKDAELIFAESPDEWVSRPSDRAARVIFLPAQYPGLTIREPYPDWRGYDRFVFEVYSDLPEPVDLVLRIHDARHNDAYYDRFNRRLTVCHGGNRFPIPLEDVKAAPRERSMDLERIRGITLFTGSPERAFALWVDEFRLERD